MSRRAGSNNVICDVCGFQFKAYEIRRRWDGRLVCWRDWEKRNILDFFRPKNDYHKLPFIRNPGEPIYIESGGTVCTLARSQGRADIGTADCAKADFITP